MPKPKGRHVPRSASPRPGEIARARAGHSTRTNPALAIVDRILQRIHWRSFSTRTSTRRSTLPDRSRDRRHPPAQERAALPRAALWRWRMGGAVLPEALGFADTQLPSLNDDRVGRCLDRLFRSDVTSLVFALATHVVREFQVDLDELHNDSTTVTFHGVYADATEEEKRGQATRWPPPGATTKTIGPTSSNCFTSSRCLGMARSPCISRSPAAMWSTTRPTAPPGTCSVA